MFWSRSGDDYAPSDLKIIGFIGCDGAGTTTHANHAVEFLRSEGYIVQKEWMRFDYRFSLPILAFARLLGLTEIEGDPEIHQVRLHQFEQSKLVTYLYKWTVIIDQHIMSYLKLNSISEETDVLVCDRFILDALVDLVVSTKEMDFLENDIARMFWELVPSHALLIGLECDAETIASRRKDVAQDPYLELRTEAYRRLFQHKRIDVIDTSQPIESAKKSVKRIIGEKHANSS